MTLDLQDVTILATNRYGWRFLVGRVDDRWVGAALGDLEDGSGFLNVLSDVSEDYLLGLPDRALAIRQTCACALDPEGAFGGVDEWLIPEAERGTLADLPQRVEDDYGDDDRCPICGGPVPCRCHEEAVP